MSGKSIIETIKAAEVLTKEQIEELQNLPPSADLTNALIDEAIQRGQTPGTGGDAEFIKWAERYLDPSFGKDQLTVLMNNQAKSRHGEDTISLRALVNRGTIAYNDLQEQYSVKVLHAPGQVHSGIATLSVAESQASKYLVNANGGSELEISKYLGTRTHAAIEAVHDANPSFSATGIDIQKDGSMKISYADRSGVVTRLVHREILLTKEQWTKSPENIKKVVEDQLRSPRK